MGSRAYWPDRAWGGGGQAAATWPRTRSIPPTPPARLRPQRRAPRGRTGQRSGGSRTRTTAESPAPAPRPPAGRAYGRGSRASRRRSRLRRARASPRRRSPWGKLPVTTPGAVRLVVRAGCAHAPQSSKVISFSFNVHLQLSLQCVLHPWSRPFYRVFFRLTFIWWPVDCGFMLLLLQWS